MRPVQNGPVFGMLAACSVLGVLAATTGLRALAIVAGLTCAIAINTLLASGLVKTGSKRLGPADRVTLVRATLVAGVASMAADSFLGGSHVMLLVGVTAAALALDAVDGRVARRTDTVSDLGARFDMEIDALLILVLSLYVSRLLGGWVLVIGAARYVFLAASLFLPWLREPSPPRYWCKVVAATQGVVLAFAAADVAPRPVAAIAVAVSLALLAESFGREVWWLWSHRANSRHAIARIPNQAQLAGEVSPA